MGARESPSHVMSFSHGSFQARTAQVGLQFVAKENTVFQLSQTVFKNKSTFGTRQAIAVFTLRDKKTHETKEGHFIVKN